mmetsp:Transcript_9865/g.19712  ORF Transcript_9865/g.19712 Transcript_9865/m.19712 type:complete len:306 (+) Transcript_9865:97-1014(+)
MRRATPAMVHLPSLCLVLMFAVNTHVCPRSSVLYTGQGYTFVSILSAGTALMRMMGILANWSLGRLSSMLDSFSSHRAPSIVSPETYAPSLFIPGTWAGSEKRVTSVWLMVRSRGHSMRRAVVCMTAVRKDWGEKRPEIHVTLGSPSSPVQMSSCFCRSSRLFSQELRGRREGYAMLSHFSGTLLSARLSIKLSITSVICKSPRSPRASSPSDRRISVVRITSRSISWRNTLTYGERSSMRSRMSTMTNSSGRRSRISSSCACALSCTVMPPIPPALRGCNSTMLWNISSACVLRKLISALGCRP